MNATLAIHRIIRGGILGLLMCALGHAAHAIPAPPGPQELTQPDGTRITLRIHGDEWLHWMEDLDGFPVICNGGTYVYARVDGVTGRLTPTDLQVGRSNPAAAGLSPGYVPAPSLLQGSRAGDSETESAGRPTTAVSPLGTVRNLVILCQFSNHSIPANGHPQADYNVLFNTIGGDPTLAPTGSVRDIYNQDSYGQCTLSSTVVAWVTLPQTEAYYASGDSGRGDTYPTNVDRMCEDALNLVNGSVNFADFDQDNDGFVDAIDFIHSGYGSESTGNPNQIWSHRGRLNTVPGGQWSSGDPNANGVSVKVYDYHTEPALYGSSGNNITRVGVIAHETGHFFGLPDLYDIDYTSFGIGSWCMMANSWGFDGDQLRPPHFSAWCKWRLGWISPTYLTTPGTYTIDQAETSPQAYVITSIYRSGEYLLIENREPVGHENHLPHGGLAIWHIDQLKGSLSLNDVNTDEGFPGQGSWPQNNRHYHVALLQADGRYDLEHKANQGDSTDLYLHSGLASRINASTTPNTNGYQSGIFVDPGHSLMWISENGPTMSFRYARDMWVDRFHNGLETGEFIRPFNTLAEGINNVPTGGNLMIKGAAFADTPYLDKPMVIDSYLWFTTIGRPNAPPGPAATDAKPVVVPPMMATAPGGTRSP